MNRLETINRLCEMLLAEMPEYRKQAADVPQDEVSRRRLLRSLMNIRPPMPLSPQYTALQDSLLSAEREEKGVVDASALPACPHDPQLILWQGDITRLKTGAIVNAANSALLGCFIPCHNCIDNVIHSTAGLQLRNDCSSIMKEQGHPEATGQAKITDGYNLPAACVIHTVGPVIQDQPSAEDEKLLAGCYRSCLKLADETGLSDIAFCCISTGVFHFPNERAAEIAVQTVRDFLKESGSSIRVIFTIFKDKDYEIYQRLLYR